jgi:hypothetical protein
MDVSTQAENHSHTRTSMNIQPKATSTSRSITSRDESLPYLTLNDRIYYYLRGCERGDYGLLENVPYATISELMHAFGKSDAIIRRSLNQLFAQGGVGLVGDKAYPIPGYRPRTSGVRTTSKKPRERQTLKTRKIAGYEITLAEGVRYCATRPIAPPANMPVTVSIHELPSGIGVLPALQITTLNREEADKLLRRFNSGRTSLDGRVW